MTTSVLWLSAIAIVSTAIVWAGSDLLERSSRRLAVYYGLPAVVQGAVVIAIGSSFPELASVVIAAVVHGSFDLGVGIIVGSAIFNVLVIPALSTLKRPPLSVDRDVVYKEGQFYMLAIAILLLTFSFGVIYNADGTGTESVVGRPLALIPLGMYVLYVFIQYQDIVDYEPAVDPRWESVWRDWLQLLAGLLLILIAVEGLVRAAIGFGEIFGTPSFLWGLTIVAAATSLPDAVLSVRAADHAEGEISVANVLGSNTFDLLVVLPIGVLIIGSTVVNFALAVPMLGVLTLATIALFTAMRTDLEITRTEAAVLLLGYVAFVAWILLETIGWIDTLPGV